MVGRGQQQKKKQKVVVLQWLVFVVIVLVTTYGSRGTLSRLRHHFSKQSEVHHVSRVLLLQATHSFISSESKVSEDSLISPSLPPHELPTSGIIASPGPEVSAAQPPSKGATAPTYSSKEDGSAAPTSPIVPSGSLLNPPTTPKKPEVLPPAVVGPILPVHSSPPSDHVDPGEGSAVPPSQQTSPSTAPNRPTHSSVGTPMVGELAPNGSSPVALPHAQVPVPSHVGGNSHVIGTPTASPPVETSRSSPPEGFVASPPSSTNPATNGTSYGEPVPAPQSNFTSTSAPHSYLPPNGSTAASPLATPPTVPQYQHGVPAAAPPNQVSNHLNNHSRNSSATTSSPPLVNPPSNHNGQHRVPPAASPPEVPFHLINHSHAEGPDIPPIVSAPPNSSRKHNGSSHTTPAAPVPTPAPRASGHLSPEGHPAQTKGSPAISPVTPEAAPPSDNTTSPSNHAKAPSGKASHVPAPAPSMISHGGPASERTSPADAPSHPFPSQPPHPAKSPRNGHKHHSPPTEAPGPSATPHHAEDSGGAPAPSAGATDTHNSTEDRGPVPSPVFPPTTSISDQKGAPKLQPVQALPPPPPNLDCVPLTCTPPLTNSPPGSPCRCVLPINIGLRLSISLYTFFPLVSELAKEIASGVSMKQSQVRIMGANSDSENIDQTIVLIDLVPLGESFAHGTPFFVFQKFWHKQVFINSSNFGGYTVLYVNYPGLPPSPPSATGNMNGGGSSMDPSAIRPLAVDVNHRQKRKENSGVIAIIVLSAVIAVVLSFGCVWLLFLKYRGRSQTPTSAAKTSQPPLAKASGSGPALSGSRHDTESTSFSSSIAPYTGSAKTFTLAEMERATNKFDSSRTIGEGGFGRVYEGILDDGTKVAVKVLKRDDRQGSREFLAEVEMLSRLHHRNLIKLIGICTESHIRCLVYELLTNGSVESHLHGADKETAPLDWSARVKIALGAARGLAYLHEDSSPRVIHRDFKSSNILLEEDFTPKVSDFGLARAALGEGHEYISTRVMGTFGYVAPEYAMTGHLLVKSDVYSYGVVLLELLTGRKPVDMLRPPGQESLVTWARPYLTSKEGLESIIDPYLGTDIPFDSVAKVAAIASMCVQPEVNQRPFMGEVVQALKLVCNDGDDYKGSELYGQDDIPAHETEISVSMEWELEPEKMISASDIFNSSARFTKDVSGSFRRYSSTGPLRPGSKGIYSQPTHGLSTGSTSDHGKFGKSLDDREQWS